MQTKVLTRHMTHDRLTHNRSKTLTEVSSNTLAMQTSITQGLIHKAKQGHASIAEASHPSRFPAHPREGAQGTIT